MQNGKHSGAMLWKKNVRHFTQVKQDFAETKLKKLYITHGYLVERD